MTDETATTDVIEQRIRHYLAEHGGAVEDPHGCSITREMAASLGVDRPMSLSVALAKMDDEGTITRDIRGFRTYRIALVTADDVAAAAAPNGATAPVEAQSHLARRLPVVGDAPVGDEPAPGGKAISLREALGRRSAELAPHRAGHTPLGAPAEGSGPTGRAGPAVAPAVGVAPAVAVAPGEGDGAGAEGEGRAEPLPKAMTLREAIAAGAGGTSAPPAARHSSLRGAPPPARAFPAAGAAAASARSESDIAPARPKARFARRRREAPPLPPTAADDDDKAPRSRGQWRRHLTVPIPEMKAEPSNMVLAVVGVVVAILVAVTVIAVVVSRRSSHYEPGQGTVVSSIDACRVVTAADASSVFGHNAGVAHPVLGSCVYDDGTHELIVQVARKSAEQLFTSSRSTSARDVPGVGSAAYYDNGRLWVLKGATVMQMILGPIPSTTPNPKLLTMARSVAAGL